jgi:hypothetical protein
MYSVSPRQKKSPPTRIPAYPRWAAKSKTVHLSLAVDTDERSSNLKNNHGFIWFVLLLLAVLGDFIE